MSRGWLGGGGGLDSRHSLTLQKVASAGIVGIKSRYGQRYKVVAKGMRCRKSDIKLEKSGIRLGQCGMSLVQSSITSEQKYIIGDRGSNKVM